MSDDDDQAPVIDDEPSFAVVKKRVDDQKPKVASATSRKRVADEEEDDQEAPAPKKPKYTQKKLAAPEEDEDPPVAPKKSMKRIAPDADEGGEDTPMPKKPRGAPMPSADRMRALQASAAAMAKPAPAEPKPLPQITEERDPHMFYPDMYDTFDPERVVAIGDPQTAKVGGGKLLFINYLYPDGVEKALCVQAPKMYMPAGIKDYVSKYSNKIDTNALCSLGKDWEKNPQLVGFRALCDKINQACARLVVAKGMHKHYCKTVDDVLACMTKICFVSEKWTEEDEPRKIVYDPSIKLKVNKADNNRSLIVTRITLKDGTSCYAEITPTSVARGSSIIPMINFQWIFRNQKSAPPAWGFNVSSGIYQAIIEPPSVTCPSTSGHLNVIMPPV